MTETLANLIALALGVYVAAGVLFGVPFVLFGVSRIDPAARGGTWGFRLIVLPGVVALWPLLARRWIAGAPPPEEATAHRRSARRKEER